VLGSFLVSLSSQLARSSLVLYQDLLVCQVILEYLYSLSPAIALYQVLSFFNVYSIIFSLVPPLREYKYDNPIPPSEVLQQ
jgi:hypothetical protein